MNCEHVGSIDRKFVSTLDVGSIPSHGRELKAGGQRMTDSWTDKKRLSLDNRPRSIPLYRVAREVWFVLTFFRFYSSWSTLYSWKFGQSSRRGKNPSSIFICDNYWVFKLFAPAYLTRFFCVKDFTWLVAPAAFIWITENKGRTVLPPGLCWNKPVAGF